MSGSAVPFSPTIANIVNDKSTEAVQFVVDPTMNRHALHVIPVNASDAFENPAAGAVVISYRPQGEAVFVPHQTALDIVNGSTGYTLPLNFPLAEIKVTPSGLTEGISIKVGCTSWRE